MARRRENRWFIMKPGGGPIEFGRFGRFESDGRAAVDGAARL